MSNIRLIHSLPLFPSIPRDSILISPYHDPPMVFVLGVSRLSQSKDNEVRHSYFIIQFGVEG